MKQTAIEWLMEKREKEGGLYFSDFCEAKEMEKEQIIDAYIDGYDNPNNTGEQYYNETYKK